MFREAFALLKPPPLGGAIPEWKPLADRIASKHAEYLPFLQNASTFVEMESFLRDVVGISDRELIYGIDSRALSDVKAIFFLLHGHGSMPAPEGVERLPKHFISRAYGFSLGLDAHCGKWEAWELPGWGMMPEGDDATGHSGRHLFSMLMTAYSRAIAHGGDCHEDHMEDCSEFKSVLRVMTGQSPAVYTGLLEVAAAMPLNVDPIDFCELVRTDGLAVATAVHVDGVPLEYARASK